MWKRERKPQPCFPAWTDRPLLVQHRTVARLPAEDRVRCVMVAVDVELLLHYGVRLFMREEGMNADQAFDTAVLLLVALRAQDTRDPDQALELVMDSLLLPELRERILPAYRKPNPDLSDLGPVIQAEKEAAAKAQRQRRRRRQLGGRP